MDFKERRAELERQMKELEKEERREKAKEIKSEQRKKNDFCKREFGMSYRDIKLKLSETEPTVLSEEEQAAIQFWNDVIAKYEPTNMEYLVAHILSDTQINYYKRNCQN